MPNLVEPATSSLSSNVELKRVQYKSSHHDLPLTNDEIAVAVDLAEFNENANKLDVCHEQMRRPERSLDSANLGCSSQLKIAKPISCSSSKYFEEKVAVPDPVNYKSKKLFLSSTNFGQRPSSSKKKPPPPPAPRAAPCQFWFDNRTQASIKADRQIKEYFYHCIRNFDYPMRVNYCWDFSANHENLFKKTLAKKAFKRICSAPTAEAPPAATESARKPPTESAWGPPRESRKRTKPLAFTSTVVTASPRKRFL
ncbi:hypothetical protein DAPPUDRAFT_277555, partial [Daphnia pulex]